MIEIINNPTISRDEVMRWVNTLNAFPADMIEKLKEIDEYAWKEVTSVLSEDTIVVVDPDRVEFVDLDGNEFQPRFYSGTIEEVKKNDDNSYTYIIVMENMDGNDVSVLVPADAVERDMDLVELPMWQTMFQFGSDADTFLMNKGVMVQLLSEHGFRVYKHDKWGYFFGIDAAGFNFYDDYWIPFYKARLELLDKI